MSWSWKEGGKEELDFAVESGNGRLASWLRREEEEGVDRAFITAVPWDCPWTSLAFVALALATYFLALIYANYTE